MLSSGYYIILTKSKATLDTVNRTNKMDHFIVIVDKLFEKGRGKVGVCYLCLMFSRTFRTLYGPLIYCSYAVSISSNITFALA